VPEPAWLVRPRDSPLEEEVLREQQESARAGRAAVATRGWRRRYALEQISRNSFATRSRDRLVAVTTRAFERGPPRRRRPGRTLRSCRTAAQLGTCILDGISPISEEDIVTARPARTDQRAIRWRRWTDAPETGRTARSRGAADGIAAQLPARTVDRGGARDVDARRKSYFAACRTPRSPARSQIGRPTRRIISMVSGWRATPAIAIDL